MNYGLQAINTSERKKINDKFSRLGRMLLLTEWADTLNGEIDELRLFLLTSPTFNDLEEYIDGKILVWEDALGTFPDGKKHIDKFLTAYQMLTGFVDKMKVVKNV